MQSSDFLAAHIEFSRRAHRKVHRIINNYPVTGSSFVPLHLDSGQVGSDALVHTVCKTQSSGREVNDTRPKIRETPNLVVLQCFSWALA
jgi:hypothetical protein